MTSPLTCSVVVPTYKRPDTLRVALESILQSIRRPDEVLVVDDDTLPQDFLKSVHDTFRERQIPFHYHQKDHATMRRGLSESKNWAAELAQSDVICFFDDDVKLAPDYLTELMKIWEVNSQEEKLIGIGGRAVNHRPVSQPERLFRILFGLTGECSWDVNDVGFQVWDEAIDTVEHAYYLHGCASSYRTKLLRATPFATFAGGRTALEDVEHCLRTKQDGYYFLYAPTARLEHYHAPVGRDAAFAAGKKESRNRKEIFRSLCRQDISHKIWFWWANIGSIIRKLLAFKFREASGMMAGLFSSNASA
ncbi:MAG: glycosyltransferase [Candidatus Paceibacterota bacterium]